MDTVMSSSKEPPHYERNKNLEAVARDAASAWTKLPEPWKVDKEFILRALKESPTLPSKSDFERRFPQSLRFDKEVVLGFCSRPDFSELYYSRHLYVPGCLNGDKDVMLAYCQTIPRSLQECTEELCNDRQVVEAAVRLGGLELQYASLELQRDRPLVETACRSHGRALEFCPPGPTRTSLTQDREFMLHTVLAKPGGGPMWKLAPSSLQGDEQLLLQALKHGLLLRDMPAEFWRPNFLVRALRENAQLYLELHPRYQPMVELALEAVVAPDSTPDIHKRALENCPSLQQNRRAVLAICDRGDIDFLQECLLPQSEFIDDVEIMRLAISRDSKLFALASPRLQEMPEIILVSITPTSAWNTLKTVPWAIQRQHPEITIKAISLCLLRNLRYLPSHVPEDLWSNNREVCLAWIRRGGRVLESFERLLRNDPGMALELAEHNWSEFHKIGDVLLGDRDFMLQALQRNGRVLRFASPTLRQDFEILVMAVAHHYPKSPTVTTTTNTNHNADQQQQQQQQHPPAGAQQHSNPHVPSVQSTFAGICNLPELQSQIQSRLDMHDTFVLDFLRGIAIVTPHIAPNKRSQLPMLDRGVETSEAFKRVIAEYLGVPIGSQLGLLRRARSNLTVLPSFADGLADSNHSSSNAPGSVGLGAGAAFQLRTRRQNQRLLLEQQQQQMQQQQQQHQQRIRLLGLNMQPPAAAPFAIPPPNNNDNDGDASMSIANEERFPLRQQQQQQLELQRQLANQIVRLEHEENLLLQGDVEHDLVQGDVEHDLAMEFLLF